MPGRYFSWRIRGNPLSFLNEYQQELTETHDLCIATSMVDLATLKSIVPTLSKTPCLIYFHENQFAYPASDKQHDSLEPKMVNLYSVLAADKALFNSQYNRESFCYGIDGLMSSMPDCAPKELSKVIVEKSEVLPVPLQAGSKQAEKTACSELPKLVWNHRWEYDKGPDLLQEVIRQLNESGKPYRLAIIGQQFRQVPPAFEKIKTLIDGSDTLELEQWGYLESREAYWQCLRESDFVLSTAIHDFQGLAVLEAVSVGCIPILPHRLVYPEWFDEQYLYSKDAMPRAAAKSAVELIERHMTKTERAAPELEKLSWDVLRPAYQKVINGLLKE